LTHLGNYGGACSNAFTHLLTGVVQLIFERLAVCAMGLRCFDGGFATRDARVVLHVLRSSFAGKSALLSQSPTPTGRLSEIGLNAGTMAAGVADRLWDIGDIVKLVEAAEPKPSKRGPYKKREASIAH
jgi:hypothetical protein